jgi:hypothetical protein
MSFRAGTDEKAIEPNGRSVAVTSSHRRLGGLPAGLVAAALAGFGLLVAGCGGAKPPASVASLGPTTTTGTTPATAGSAGAPAGGSQSSAGAPSGGQFSLRVGGSVEALTKYAGCMRKNGVPDFPDPNAQGEISFSSASGIDPGSAQFQKAQQTCQKLLPNGGQPTPAQAAQARANALAFSACMRTHGEPNFPDPQFGTGGRVSIRIKQGAGLDPGSPQFQAAQSACQKDLPGKAGAIATKGAGGGAAVG